MWLHFASMSAFALISVALVSEGVEITMVAFSCRLGKVSVKHLEVS